MNNRTQQRGRGNRGNNDDQRPSYNALVVHEPRLPMPKPELLAPYGVDQSKWQALTDAVFPSAKTVPGVMLALAICKARKLDIFKRVVHIVPMWSSKHGCEIETIWPGIAEARITATRTGLYAGKDACKFGRVMRRTFEGTKSGEGQNGPWSNTVRIPEMEFPETAQITVYKIVAGVRCAFVGPEVSFIETFSGQKGMRVPNDRWQQAPRQMLEKCAEAAALRAAFPEEFGGEMFAEEMDGKTMHGDIDGRGVIIDNDAQQQSADRQQDRSRDDIQDAEIENIDDGDRQQGEAQFWDSERVESYRQYVEGQLGGARSLRGVAKWLEGQQVNLDMLAADDRKMIEQIIEAARERVAPKGQQPEQNGEQQQDGQDPPREQRQANTGEAPFLRNLRRDVDEIDTQVDLSSYESGMRRAIEAEAPEIAEAARAIIDKRRQALRAD